MKRTQISITDEQAAQIKQLALSRRTSRAHVIRQILEVALETGNVEAEARAGILATAGILPQAPDWPECQAAVRGSTTSSLLPPRPTTRRSRR